jgi:hypothetical protein
MSLVNSQWEFLQDVVKLIDYAKKQGLVLTGGELYRTEEQQAIYLKTGKSNAKYSQHQKRLAIDFNVFKNGTLTYAVNDVKPLGDYWVSLNNKNRWGGNFSTLKDTPHFEKLD